MTDMLVRLYDLPPVADAIQAVRERGILCRRAETFERVNVLRFVSEHWPNWLDEAAAAYSHVPPTMYVALEGNQPVGFACYHAARPNFFGPTAVLESHRQRGIGGALLLQCLHAMAAEGYAYAVVGGVGPREWYERRVGAFVIPGSDTGIYGSRAGGWGRE